MCIVSAAMDNFHDKNEEWFKPFLPQEVTPFNPSPKPTPIKFPTHPTQEEFDKLKKEVEALRDLLPHLKKYDEETGQPDCEMEEKINFLKEVALFLGVDMTNVFGD
jgi:hypothetical protein